MAYAAPAACSAYPAALQVLGSGGPELGRRAGPAYLLWLAGKARLLIDAGPGTRLRLAESGARLEDLDAVLLTHLHVDHANDLAALVKAGYFIAGERFLPVLGPSGNAAMPGVSSWLRALFSSDGYRYLEDHLAPAGAADFRVEAREIDVADPTARPVWQAGQLRVLAAGVGHGVIPALAYRIEGPGFSLALSGDTNADGPSQAALVSLAAGTSLLLAHHAIPETATGAARALHMPPAQIGRVAAMAGTKELVLSHRMQRTLGHERASLVAIRQSYRGPVHFADDLTCYPLSVGKRPAKGLNRDPQKGEQRVEK